MESESIKWYTEPDQQLKSKWDARQLYLEHVMKDIGFIGTYQLIEDNQNWLLAIKCLFTLASPYIKEDRRTELANQIKQIRNMLRTIEGKKNETISSQISEKLDTLTQNLLCNIKFMLLPMEEQEGDPLASID